MQKNKLGITPIDEPLYMYYNGFISLSKQYERYNSRIHISRVVYRAGNLSPVLMDFPPYR